MLPGFALTSCAGKYFCAAHAIPSRTGIHLSATQSRLVCKYHIDFHATDKAHDQSVHPKNEEQIQSPLEQEQNPFVLGESAGGAGGALMILLIHAYLSNLIIIPSLLTSCDVDAYGFPTTFTSMSNIYEFEITMLRL